MRCRNSLTGALFSKFEGMFQNTPLPKSKPETRRERRNKIRGNGGIPGVVPRSENRRACPEKNRLDDSPPPGISPFPQILFLRSLRVSGFDFGGFFPGKFADSIHRISSLFHRQV